MCVTANKVIYVCIEITKHAIDSKPSKQLFKKRKKKNKDAHSEEIIISFFQKTKVLFHSQRKK